MSRYAYAPDRIYTPPDAPAGDYAKLLKTIGINRAVLVQPSVYGTDNSALLDALIELRGRGFDCFAVAVVEPDIADHDLERMNAAGVRGIRFNLVDVVAPGTSPPLDPMRDLCSRIAPFGWHAELLMHVDEDPDLDRTFGDWPVDIVVGHMGYCPIGRTPEAPGFKALVRLAKTGRCWVKMTGPYRISAGDLPYAEAGVFARALAEASPERLLWGTDWPHVMVTKAMPNDADLVDLISDWIPDEAVRRAVLVDNPARLYGFADGQLGEG